MMHEINKRKLDQERRAKFEHDHPTGKKGIKRLMVKQIVRIKQAGHIWEIEEKKRLAEEAEAQRLKEELEKDEPKA